VPAVEGAWLWITDIEVLRLHYAYTLKAWYDRCAVQEDAITALYDARFYRMWSSIWRRRGAPLPMMAI
jgi:cyclopropane-fatty-acyl-phospholipid synthase